MASMGPAGSSGPPAAPGDFRPKPQAPAPRGPADANATPQWWGGPEIFAHLSAILDASEDAITSVTLDGTIVVWNPGAETLFGYTAAEAVGRRISLLLPADRSGEPDTILSQIARGERVDHFETVRIRKDGLPIDVSLTIFPVKDAQGGVVGAAAITRDITEEKRLERELRRWRDQLQAIAQGIDDAVVVRGPGGRVVYANDNAAHLLGFASVADLLSTPIDQTHARFAFYTESGQRIPNDQLPGLQALQGVELPPTILRFRLLLTGEERWAVIKATPIRDEQGQVQGAAAIFSDITARKRAEAALRATEARFQAFMDNSPIVAFIKDEQARFVYVNRQFERTFQAAAADLLGESDTRIVPHDVAERIHQDDAEVLATGQLRQIMEVIPDPAGAPRHWMTFKFPIVAPSGARFVGGASVEITERVRAEEALQQYAARLQTLSRQLIAAQEAERLRIARDLHDQVGQSLTAIKIDLEIAQHQAATDSRFPLGGGPGAAGSGSAGRPPRGAEFTERLATSIALLERTIEQVREFSLDLRPAILDDLGLPSALLWYVEEQARRAGFRTALAIEQLPTRLSPELEIACFRVAQEAITNAVRHAQATHVAVELRRAGDDLALTVRDDGVGFDPHFPGGALSAGDDGKIDRPPGGVGMAGPGAAQRPRDVARIGALGLAGMHERVLLVGGRLTIESAPGAGTTVRAVVPLHAFPPAGAGRGRKGRSR